MLTERGWVVWLSLPHIIIIMHYYHMIEMMIMMLLGDDDEYDVKGIMMMVMVCFLTKYIHSTSDHIGTKSKQ